MKKAIVDSGVVENVILAPEGFAIDGQELVTVPDDLPVGPGWNWDGERFSPPANASFDYASAWERIKAIRDRKIQQGGYQVAGKWFHSDTFSRTQQIGLTIMGAAIPAGLLWKTMDGSFVEMTHTLAQQVFAAAGQQDAALFAYAEQLRAQVQAAQDPASIDLEAGWPATYDRV